MALAGTPYDKQWEPQKGEFTKSDGFGYSDLLSRLGGALDAATLHGALSAEKSALADLARQAAGASAARYPLRADVDARRASAPDAAQVADFYLRSARDLAIAREGDGTIRQPRQRQHLLGTQKYIDDEPDADGQLPHRCLFDVSRDGTAAPTRWRRGAKAGPRRWTRTARGPTPGTILRARRR